MPNWSGGILTTKGQALQAKVDAGQTTLTITKMKIGSGILPNGQNLQNLNDLVVPEMIVPISSVSANGNKSTIVGAITNAGLTNGFNVRELGVYAQDPTLGEILYAITTDSAPDYLPPEGGAVTVSSEFSYNIVVSNAANVTATLDPSGLVTVSILQQHIQNKNNPHGTTAAQVGAAPDGYGVGTLATDVSGTGINLIRKTGHYRVNGDSHAPDMGWWFIEHIAHDPDKWHTQTATAYGPDAGNTYPVNTKMVRGMEAGEWGGWNVLATMDLVAPAKFGLGTFAEPLKNINIDTVVACGFYLAYNNCTNIPSTEGHYLLVESLNASYIKQTATNMSTGVIKVRFRVDGTWYGWGQIATIDLTLTDKSYAPANWNNIVTPGVYIVTLEKPTGQTNTAPQALDLYQYGQLVVTMSGSNTSVQQTYYSHVGTYAARQSFDGGATWQPWKQIPTMDLVAPAKYGIGEFVDDTHTITLNSTSTKTGFFYYAITDPNRPDSADGQILVQSFNNTSIKQIAFSWTGEIYRRQYSSSMWSEWKRIATADNVTNVTVLTGTIAHGGTIPLPSGYTEAQCHWMVSGNHMYDSSGGGYSDCSANGTRVVTATNTTGNTGTANYIIIGVK